MRVEVVRYVAGPYAHPEALLRLIEAPQVQLVLVCGVGRHLQRVTVRRQGLLLTAVVLAVKLVYHILRSR